MIYAPLLLLVTALIVFRDQFSGVSFATNQDNTYLFLPLISFASRTFAVHEYPYWINALAGGLPLYNSPQFTFDYPLYFLRFNLYTSAYSALQVWHYVTLLHYFILLVNTYVLLRVLKIRPLSALFGAVVFAFGANSASYCFTATLLAPYSWLPLFIASLLLLEEPTTSVLGFALSIFSLVMSVLAAPSLPFIHELYIGSVVSLSLLISCYRRKEHRRGFKFVALALLSGFASFVILSPYLISEYLSVPNFIRWVGEGGAIIGNAKIPFESFLLGQLSLKNLLDIAVPTGTTFLIGSPFLGMISCLLAALSVQNDKRSPVIPAFIFLALWGICSALGSRLGMAYINYRLPFFNLMREPGRHLFIFVFSTSVLSSFGLDYFESSLKRGNEFLRKKFTLACLCLAPVMFVVAFALESAQFRSSYFTLTAIASVLLIGITFVSSPSLRRWLFLAFIPVSLLATIGTSPLPVIPISAGDYSSNWNITSLHLLRRLSQTADLKHYRVIFGDGEEDQRLSMNASYYGIRSFAAYFNPFPYDLFSQMFYQGNIHRNRFELLGAKYIVCKHCDRTNVSEYEQTATIWGYKIFTSHRAFPHYRVVHRLGGTYQSAEDYYAKLGRVDYDYMNNVLIEDGTAPNIAQSLASTNEDSSHSCEVQETLSTPNRIALSVNCERPGLLVLNEFFTPNWTARVNGESRLTTRVNLNQIAVPVERGPSFVEFEYRPLLFCRLKTLSLVAICMLLLSYLLLPWSSHFLARRREKA